VQFNACWNQALPASLAPPGENRSSSFSFHPGTKAELAFASAF
jgi:hypothetical protein